VGVFRVHSAADMARPLKLSACPVVLALSLITTSSYAAPKDDPLSDSEVDARLAFVEGRLEAGTAAANRWSYGWLATYGTLSLLQVGVALGTTSPTLRRDAAVGGVAASVGVVPFGLFPFTPRFAADRLRAWPSSTPDERRHKLARGEALLKKSAEAERFGRSWVPHVLGNSVAIAWGFVLALGYHRIATGIITGSVGVGLVEVQIWTQPTAAIHDWDEYSHWHTHHATRTEGPSLSVVPSEGGVGLMARF
jgi:hypothetical protein